MPYRQTPLVTGEVYHVFNRSVARIPIFISKNDYERALKVIEFYSFDNTPLSFSHYQRSPQDQRLKIMESIKTLENKLVDILAFCLMPNHFHFLLRQKIEKGITTMLRNFQNSYAKYFNTKSERSGALFQSMFKAVIIETDEQLIHVARYIHLNPSTAYIIKDSSNLENYHWSSFPEYINNSDGLADKKELFSYFKSVEDLKKFTLDQADYQRKLGRIKHLILE